MAEQFQTQLLALAEAGERLAFLSALNSQGRDAFAKASLPTRKTENWKYTSLYSLSQIEFAAAANNSLNAELEQAATVTGFEAARLVFINGVLNAQLSDALALDEVTLFSQANAEQQALIQSKLGTVLAQQHNTGHLFNDLNNAATREGVLVHVRKNTRLAKPLQLSFLTSDNSQPFTVNSRILLVLDAGSEATVLEHYSSDNATQTSLTNALTEISLGDNAKLQHYRLNIAQEAALHLGSTYVELLRDAQYQAFLLGLGSKLTRNDLVVLHNVGGSHAEIAGVYIPQHQDVLDYHTCIEHKAAHCTSNEVFRGIVNDRAKAVFNGRIHIHPNAQKTNAQLNNKNLLLTNTAEVYTKPELEIYADDVKCAHGATVAQLDEQARFYLQSRGLSRREAEVMLSFGFINELLQALPDAAITALLRPLLAKRFGRDESLSDPLLDKELA